MKSTFRVFLLAGGFCLYVALANAQEVDTYLGFGSAHDSSTQQQINTFGDGTYYPTRDLGGASGDFGLGVILKKNTSTRFSNRGARLQSD